MFGSRWSAWWRCTLPLTRTRYVPLVVFDDFALLGEERGLLLRIAAVVEEDAEQQAVRLAFAQVKHEARARW